MIDLLNLSKYRENNRIEAKKAAGGLPRSIWETYSAFANTVGGIILLGVVERDDNTLEAVGLSNPEQMVKDFWNTVNNPSKTSVNVLSDRSVTIRDVNGKHIIVIEVPRAQRYDRPVYVDGNPLSGSYRRNGEGDYRCTREEVQAMLRDAAVKTQDMAVLHMPVDVFDYDSVRRYRQRMRNFRPGHVWEELEDVEFLYKLGAVGRGDDGQMHPTAAGLLMFGYEYEIVKEFPAYFLDYQEKPNPEEPWLDRIVSSSGDWSGNVYDFYFRVYNKLIQDVKVPFKLEGGDRIDDTPVHKALREALANMLINADYYGSRGLVVIKGEKRITFANPGNFRIDVEAAKSGGVSDPRNAALIKMFNMIDVGERAGSGIPRILKAWKEQDWAEPTITEEYEPPRTTLSLAFEKTSDKKQAIKTGDKKSAINLAKKALILSYLTEHPTGTCAEIAKDVQLSDSRTRLYLKELTEEGLVVATGSNRNRKYQLKSKTN